MCRGKEGREEGEDTHDGMQDTVYTRTHPCLLKVLEGMF